MTKTSPLIEKAKEKFEIVIHTKRYACDSKDKKLDSRPWSELPVDILSLIMERRYCLIDQIHFHTVCKNWHCVVPPIDKFPWLMTYRWSWSQDYGDNILSVCTFSSPSLNRTYSLDHIINGEEREGFIGADLFASKHGWLLLKKSDRPFFLYSPFRREIVILPNLVIGSSRATFSTTPTSPDCMIFVVVTSANSSKINISICGCRDTDQWSTYIFDGLFKDVEDVVYSKGTFYCVFNDGGLGAFGIADHDWRVLTKSSQRIDPERLCKLHMVESDGELVLVCFGKPKLVFSFDWSMMGWVKVNRLGNRALFIDKTSFAVSAEGNTRNLANRIYYHGIAYTWFYSLETRTRQICHEFYPGAVGVASKRVWIEPRH